MTSTTGMSGSPGYAPIADYGLIGNARTAALVGRDGSIDWYCWPRFDSPAVFCRLLDARRGGSLQVGPRGRCGATQAYAADSNVLCTELRTATGSVRLTDFMPLCAAPGESVQHHRLLRRIEGLSGEVALDVRFHPTFDYARASTHCVPCPGGAVATAGQDSLCLLSPAPLRAGPDGALVGTLPVRAGDVRWVVLAAGHGARPGPLALAPGEAEGQLRETLGFWRGWLEGCTYDGPYRALVRRSALVLKLLTYAPTGALVAAPTTSLPERLGGMRNWDYRYCWLRDSSLILLALQRLGFHGEAMAFWDWLRTLPLTGEDAQAARIMYTVDGSSELPERTLAHLEGYRGSRPVRVGNAAVEQEQLDIYGAVIDAADFCQAEMGHGWDDDFWAVVTSFADTAASRWREPDRGIWEVRGPPRHFLHSKLMCWVALDRALRLGQRLGRTESAARWRRERTALKRALLSQGFSPRVGAFTQAFGTEALDASALVLPLVGLLPPEDARVRATTRAVQEQLTSQGLVYRYREDDGLPGGEATFLLCSFWLVDNLALQGQLEEARALFERTAGYANALGLLSEEVDPTTGELLGNFPQGFSHLALIRSALGLQDAEARRGRHARSGGDRTGPPHPRAGGLHGGVDAARQARSGDEHVTGDQG